MITLAIDQRSIDSGNELVKPIIKVKSDNTIYFPQPEYISFYMGQGHHADLDKVTYLLKKLYQRGVTQVEINLFHQFFELL